MKINKILLKIIILLIVALICNSCICYAATEGGDSSSGGSSSIGLPNLDDYKPTAQSSGIIITATNKILGAIMILGVILITVFIAITGFETILGSSEEKAVAKEKFGGYLIAAIILTCGAAIAKIIIQVAESF